MEYRCFVRINDAKVSAWTFEIDTFSVEDAYHKVYGMIQGNVNGSISIRGHSLITVVITLDNNYDCHFFEFTYFANKD